MSAVTTATPDPAVRHPVVVADMGVPRSDRESKEGWKLATLGVTGPRRASAPIEPRDPSTVVGMNIDATRMRLRATGEESLSRLLVTALVVFRG
jgi:hypothetical protein